VLAQWCATSDSTVMLRWPAVAIACHPYQPLWVSKKKRRAEDIRVATVARMHPAALPQTPGPMNSVGIKRTVSI
jgi:hypothetical protein